MNGSAPLRTWSAACTGLFTADLPSVHAKLAPVRRGDGDLAALGKDTEGRLDILCGLCKMVCFAVTIFSVAPVSSKFSCLPCSGFSFGSLTSLKHNIDHK